MISGTHSAVEDSRNDNIFIWINGEFYKRSDAKISVFDSGYLVGDGVWEALRFTSGKLIFKELHFDRLFDSAKYIGIDVNFDRKILEKYILSTLDYNKMRDGVHVRVMLTRGIKKTPSQDPRLTISEPNLVIIPEYKTASNEIKENGITLFTSTIRRGRPDYLNPRLNCHSKLHEVQALIQALEAGADEALMLDIRGFVSTCNATNFFIVKENEVWTSTGQYCMQGITRHHVIKLCNTHKIVIKEKDFSLFDVYSADEAFVTGTFGGLTPVIKIDGKNIGSAKRGPMTQRLQNHYASHIDTYIHDSEI